MSRTPAKKLAPACLQHAEAVPESPETIEPLEESPMLLKNETLTPQARKGTASRIKRGIYPHAPHKLLKRWESVQASGAVPVGAWALRRVLADAMVHAALLYDGALYSGAGLQGMQGRQLAVTRTANGGLLAQTLDIPPERLQLVPVADMQGGAA